MPLSVALEVVGLGDVPLSVALEVVGLGDVPLSVALEVGLGEVGDSILVQLPLMHSN